MIPIGKVAESPINNLRFIGAFRVQKSRKSDNFFCRMQSKSEDLLMWFGLLDLRVNLHKFLAKTLRPDFYTLMTQG